MSSEVTLSKPFIRASRIEDVQELADNMRECDVQEVFHSSRRTPQEAVKKAYELCEGKCYTIQRGSKVVAMFGVVGSKNWGGSPWMLGTDELSKCRSLLRECLKRLDKYLKEYTYLSNAVWADNDVHIKWLLWLGFDFDGSSTRNGQSFLHFHKEYNECVNPQQC